jgi:hypothetical protein
MQDKTGGSSIRSRHRGSWAIRMHGGPSLCDNTDRTRNCQYFHGHCFKDTVSLIAFAIKDVGTVMALSQGHIVESCNLARTG